MAQVKKISLEAHRTRMAKRREAYRQRRIDFAVWLAKRGVGRRRYF